ncbi:hypothetical protein [Labrys wisconsinensis]|uniref:Uncharacterized protein n=1 Tax=Labrys wisconsinensis TaxID=425677 RepID=A0ABU0JEZ2_9HYPH|nr:hypothetical protein [Labrys wisconsinensis]MDQ0472848.1 hypothetical protein [Labrys wisconsinensis]
MPRALAAFSAIVLLQLSVSAATAETFHVHAAPGETVEVSNEAAWDKSCQGAGAPTYTFTAKPAHGAISTRPQTKVIKTCEAGHCACLGHEVLGSAIYYTPAAGFRGSDTFSFTSAFPNGRVLRHQALVTVK